MKIQIANQKLKIENHRRRATAFSAAIIMMVFVTAAILAMTTLFTHEAKRTRAAVADAQLRQLLLAADPAAREELARNPAPHDLTLPTPVPNATLTLHIQSDNTTATIHTTAALADTRAATTNTYTRTNNTWTLQSSTLTGM